MVGSRSLNKNKKVPPVLVGLWNEDSQLEPLDNLLVGSSDWNGKAPFWFRFVREVSELGRDLLGRLALERRLADGPGGDGR